MTEPDTSGKILKICGCSDTGRQRDHNEDSFLIGNLVENKSKLYLEIPVESLTIKNYGIACAVADGMGGHNAGEVASDLALNILTNQLRAIRKELLPSDELENKLRDAILFAHQEILQLSEKSIELSGMGATLAGLFFCKDVMYTFHVGDSRVYRLRHGGLLQLTKDHSLVQSLVDLGKITAEEAMLHPQKSTITNSLAGGNNVCDPEITDKFGYYEQDIFLICSDGLSDMLDDEIITGILTDESTIKEKVEMLINNANDRGGVDNITVVLIDMEDSNE